MQEAATLELIHDPVQEFFVSHIGKTEIVEGILVRLYCYKQMGNQLELQYTALIPLKRLGEMGRLCLRVGAEANVTQVWDDVTMN